MPEATELDLLLATGFDGKELTDLRVKIPERFKESLSRRFDAARAELEPYRLYRTIAEPCGLCAEYIPPNCKGCPFLGFKEGDSDGCMVWASMVLDEPKLFVCDEHIVRWQNAKNAAALQQLANLRERAEELIEWTTDTPPTQE